MLCMKRTTTVRKTLEALITERLQHLGADSIPTGARELIEDDVRAACARIVQRTVTGPRVGRAVAHALAKNNSDTQTDNGQLPLFAEGKA